MGLVWRCMARVFRRVPTSTAGNKNRTLPDHRNSMALHLACTLRPFTTTAAFPSPTTTRLNPSLPPSPPSRLRLAKQPRSSSSPSPAVAPSVPGTTTNTVRLTYLEGNGWLWDVGGSTILVDPILVGNLDFGVPWLYDAAKRVLKNFRLEDLPELDCLLITQSLDDHCHVKTLRAMSPKLPDLRVVATPNAEAILSPLFKNVTYIEPGQSFELEGKDGTKVNIFATAGPVLGPPWQRPENGYIITPGRGELTLYYEPHCVYNQTFLQKCKADIVITPVVKQLLPSFTLVSGQEDAVQLAKLLQAKYIVPMKNGDLESQGILSSIIDSVGTVESFKELLLRELPDAQILEPTPGVPLEIGIPSDKA